MNNIFRIRQLLGLSQKAFGGAIGVSQGNVSHYEHGQDVPAVVARRIIDAAAQLGVHLGFDDIYLPASDPPSRPRPLSASGQGANTASPTAAAAPSAAPVQGGGVKTAGKREVA